jgi:hypothetical protein
MPLALARGVDRQTTAFHPERSDRYRPKADIGHTLQIRWNATVT